MQVLKKQSLLSFFSLSPSIFLSLSLPPHPHLRLSSLSLSGRAVRLWDMGLEQPLERSEWSRDRFLSALFEDLGLAASAVTTPWTSQ